MEKQAEFERLRSLAKDGINRFWSRTIKVDKKQVCVKVSVSNRCGPQALPINLMVDPDPDDPARGRNSGLTFLTARIVHKPQFYSTPAIADQAFQIEAAHELGHSVLMNAGGVGLSWSHKGTTHLWQQANGSAPSHPPSGGIDLMKYYRKDGSYASVTDQFRRKKATEKDIKRLIWGARFQWIN